MLVAVYLFAGFLAGFALAGALFALATRHGEEESDGCKHIGEPWGEGEISPLRSDGRLIGRIVVQTRACVACNELEYRRDNTTTRESFMDLHPVLAVIIGILAMLGFIFLIGLIAIVLGDYASLFWILVCMAAGGVIGWSLLSRR